MDLSWRSEQLAQTAGGLLTAVVTALLLQAAFNTLRLLASLLVGYVLPRFTHTDVRRHGHWAGERRGGA